PGTSRLEIAGEMGKLLLENDTLLFYRNETSMFKHSKTSRLGFQKPDAWKIEIPISNEPAQHTALTQNFVDAILDGIPLIAPGEDGIHSIELANALLYSGLMEKTIDLPLDSAAYEAKLNGLIAASKTAKKVVAVSNEDFTNSFRR
ncbi:MAG TPA: gfo/Idh/MocA family oxidoreductase, partial [Verrucomicrobiae bacterium]|nr:gfo/Idh/MocA family oxidoreductase [Verrucomicrobiae bacterium]